MSVAHSQHLVLLELFAQLRPHWRSDRALPARIQNILARDRRFGSRDRRLYRELIYTTLRHLPWIEPELDRDPDRAVQTIAWLAADSPATGRFRAAWLAGWPPCPATLAEKAAVLSARAPATMAGPEAPPIACDPAALLPEWFRDHCPEAFVPAQLEAQLARAPLWLRVQTGDVSRVTDEFAQLGWRLRRSSLLPAAIQLLDEVDLTKTAAYQQGLVEIQDLGSQLLLESAGIASGGEWLDACAGAGGKTLQLALLLGSGGRIDAWDVRADALNELAVRANRAGFEIAPASGKRSEAAGNPRQPAAAITMLGAPPAQTYDGVLVDAPCSGSGTWRRAPHLKWTTMPRHVERAAARQQELLGRLSPCVRPGGRLIYATCSLSRRENEDVVASFLAAQPDFVADPPARDFGAALRDGGLTFLPALHDTDGFFVATLRRRQVQSGG